MRKQVCSISIAFIMVLGLFTMPASALDGIEGVYSSYAEGWLKKALDYGLVTDKMKTADLTKPITREEFCEIVVRLVSSVTGVMPEPVSPNPFTDTDNIDILRARTLSITSGITPTTFEPDTLIPREQCAMMLLRAVQAIAPDGDYNVGNVTDFTDQGKISPFAQDAAKYMNLRGFIKGDLNRNFMPDQNTTREDAFIMICKIYEAFAGDGSKLSAAEALFADGVIHMVFLLEYDDEEMLIEMFMKGGKTAVILDMFGMKIRAVIADGKSYGFIDELRVYMELEPDEFGMDDLPIDTMFLSADAVFIGTGTASFKGRSLYFEEYAVDGDGTTVRYFFDGGGLAGIEASGDGETVGIEILTLDKEVPDSIFNIPSGYIKL
ncbi:MAG: S-layer homology domain-containing protein [Oscillospiraceae bacterium]|nr:S-layer homology domain-containing protein [Oscillospiraceae bacterium]